jgi:hypothetical protein
MFLVREVLAQHLKDVVKTFPGAIVFFLPT